MRATNALSLVLVLLVLVVGQVSAQTYVGNGDLDGDGVINAEDLILMQQQWQTDGAETSFDAVLPQNRNLPLSLHADAEGMRYLYELPDGIGPLTGVDYDDLACKNCHVDSCLSCHAQPDGTYDATQNCLPCHGRQMAEIGKGLTDVHRDAGMSCGDCHSSEQIHGDGNEYVSMLEAGSPNIDCTSCHTELNMSVTEHTLHGSNIDCAACHSQSVITCNNCHFDSEVSGLGKIARGQFTNFVMLVNDDESGKITTATYQSLYHNATDSSFVVFAPFYGHSITAAGRTCNDCHNNPYAADLVAGASVEITKLVGGNIVHATGVIPVAAGQMQLQYMNLTNPEAPVAERVWVPTKTTTDQEQFGFCTPLSLEQLQKID